MEEKIIFELFKQAQLILLWLRLISEEMYTDYSLFDAQANGRISRSTILKIFISSICACFGYVAIYSCIFSRSRYYSSNGCVSSNGLLQTECELYVIENMAEKNLRVGNLTIEATGFDKQGHAFWILRRILHNNRSFLFSVEQRQQVMSIEK